MTRTVRFALAAPLVALALAGTDAAQEKLRIAGNFVPEH